MQGVNILQLVITVSLATAHKAADRNATEFVDKGVDRFLCQLRTKFFLLCLWFVSLYKIGPKGFFYQQTDLLGRSL